MSIRSGIDDRYDITIFNTDAWKAVYEYITKQYVDDNFANLYSSNLFRGFNFFQNGISWTGGQLLTDGSILLYDTNGNTVTISKSKMDMIDASLNYLEANMIKKELIDASLNLIDASLNYLDVNKASQQYVLDMKSLIDASFNLVDISLYDLNVNKASNLYVKEYVNNVKSVIDASLNVLNTEIDYLNDNKASHTDLQTAIAGLIDNSPEVLDTLNEISQALNNDPSFSNTIITQLATKLDKDEYQTDYDTLNSEINTKLNKIAFDASYNFLNANKANLNNPTFTGTVNGITKSMVGLSNVDNTSDINKPVSTATQNALNLKADISNPTLTGLVKLSGYESIEGRNNTTFSHTQNVQNINGLQLQYNRDNSTFQSYFINNRSGQGGGFRFQRYNDGVFVDEPISIGDAISVSSDLFIVNNRSFSVANATLGSISQSEINCLNNCNINIITKFNNTDTLIADLQTVTSGVSYTAGSDTTTIDNNLAISSGKVLTLGSTNVNNFISDTNTFITNTTNTLQGVAYTSANDTTTVSNNVNITGNLVVQNMNVKSKIDALDTSLTTVTLNATTINGSILNASTLNVSNQINMTNPTRTSRNINGIGFLRFVDYSSISNTNVLSIGQDGIHTYFNNAAVANGQYQFLGTNANGVNNTKRLIISPDSHDNRYNTTTELNDVVVAGVGAGVNDTTLNLVSNSTTANGVRIQPTRTTVTGGNNNMYVDNSQGIVMNGNVSMTNFNLSVKNISCEQIDMTGNLNMPNSDLFVQDVSATKIDTTFLNASNSANIANAAQFIPNTIFENSFPKTLQVNQTIYCGLFSVSEYDRTINMNIPISIYRQYRNINTGDNYYNFFEDILNSVNFTIYKNNNLFSSGVCTYTDSMPRIVRTNSDARLTSRNYEIYITNVRFSFTPTYSINTSDIYTMYLTPNYTINIPDTAPKLGGSYIVSSNIIIEQFGYFANTSQSGTTVVLSNSNAGLQFSSTSFTTSSSGNYYNLGGIMKTNLIVSNDIDNQNSIKTNSINTNSLTCNNYIKAKSIIAGYYVNNGTQFVPIFCSQKQLFPNDSDSFWIIMPNYQFFVYEAANYSGNLQILQNLTNNEPVVVGSNKLASSVKVFYLGEEITLTNIS